jgi:hypothetical protein
MKYHLGYRDRTTPDDMMTSTERDLHIDASTRQGWGMAR